MTRIITKLELNYDLEWNSVIKCVARAFFVLIFLLYCIVLYADDKSLPARAGWIESFNEPSDNYELIRRDETLDISYLMPLFVGDKIVIKIPQAQVDIRLGDEKILQLDQANSPYEVPQPSTAPTLLSNFTDWAGNWLTGLHDSASPIMAVTLISRGDGEIDPPKSGLFNAKKISLIEGQRSISIGWLDGQPPFRIDLQENSISKEKITEENRILDRFYRLPSVLFEPGNYILRITDIQERTLEVHINVLTVDSLPMPSTDDIPDSLPRSVKNALQALWLASQDDGWTWRLEAYQGINDENDYPPAVVLRNALLKGVEWPVQTQY